MGERRRPRRKRNYQHSRKTKKKNEEVIEQTREKEGLTQVSADTFEAPAAHPVDEYTDGAPAQSPQSVMSSTSCCGWKNSVVLHDAAGYEAEGTPQVEESIVVVAEVMSSGMSARCCGLKVTQNASRQVSKRT